MPIGHWQLLKWMVDREEREPGRSSLFGSQLLEEAAADLATGEDQPRDQVARALLHLKQLEYVGWRYTPVPNVDPPEPPLEFITDAFLQRVQGIHVTAGGYGALASRFPDNAPRVNIVNSTVGQVAFGDIRNIDIFVILDATEKALETLDAPAEEKEEAKATIRRMRDAGGTVVGSAAGSVLGAAFRQALGLP